MSPHPEVLVLGGGPAGCAAAIAARRQGLSVTLVEAGDYAEPRIGESLPPDAGVLLRRLGVWDRFVADAHLPCKGSCSSWGSDRLGYNDFLLNPHGAGWHLDRQRFDHALAEAAAAAGVGVHRGAWYAGQGRRGDGGPRVMVDGPRGPRVIEPRVVVDATGRRGLFARDRGARRAVLDRLIAVAGFWTARADDEAISSLTMLEATADGYWYGAALPGGRRVAVVASDADLARRAGLTTIEGWRRALGATRHLSTLMGVARPSSVMPWAAPSFVLDHAAGPDWIAVGDAASAYDPLSAQGIYKALDDGLAAGSFVARLAAGEAGAAGEWTARISGRYATFCEQRAWFYAMERRWPDAPFWSRRRAAAAGAERLAAAEGIAAAG